MRISKLLKMLTRNWLYFPYHPNSRIARVVGLRVRDPELLRTFGQEKGNSDFRICLGMYVSSPNRFLPVYMDDVLSLTLFSAPVRFHDVTVTLIPCRGGWVDIKRPCWPSTAAA